MDNLPLYNDDTSLQGTIATDDIAGVHFPRSKIGWGADGVYSDVSAVAPLPVMAVQSGTWNVGTLSTITNVVHVDDNAGSLTVDGTVAATQSGAWNIGTLSTITNVVHVDDNGGSLTVDGSVSVTPSGAFPVQVDSPLPAGTNVLGGVTQSGTWNLGTLSTITNVVHVDDNSGTLSVDDGGGSLTVDGTISATQSGTWNLGTLSTITNVVHVDDNSGTLSVDDAGGSLTVDGTVGAAQSGTWDIGTVATITNVVHVDDNGTSLTVDGTVSISGSVAATQSGAWSVTLGAALPTGANTIGAVSQNGTWNIGLSAGTNSVGKLIPEASASGTGTSAFRHASLSSTAQQVKGSAGRVYGLHAFNPNTSEIYLQLYDHASPTVGTTTPSRTYAVPVRGWLTLDLTIPQSYATAIHVAATTTIAGSTAPGTGLLVDVEYV